ncbi:hypothetical protein CLV71_10787 [Actinophytocola oryzae]|uniref:Aspartate kinase n=1 Tax=Actinophytocola oryzae TaxID=502181 RepID=A0A4R7VKL9_9PSEU|nr:hypothetical protein CLV71_10787 [Actinophytocola oryzae]
MHASSTAAKITVTGVPDHATAAVLRVVAEQGVVPGMVSRNPAGPVAVAFTVDRSAGPVVLAALGAARDRIGFRTVDLDDNVAVVMLTGAGLRADPVVPATFCEVLAREGVRLGLVSFDNARISATCGGHEAEATVRALREVFEVGRGVPTSRGWWRPSATIGR